MQERQDRNADAIKFIDKANRKHLKEVDPKRNVWQIFDTYSEGKKEQIEKALEKNLRRCRYWEEIED